MLLLIDATGVACAPEDQNGRRLYNGKTTRVNHNFTNIILNFVLLSCEWSNLVAERNGLRVRRFFGPLFRIAYVVEVLQQ